MSNTSARDLIPSYPFINSAPDDADDAGGGEDAFAAMAPNSRPISVSVVDEIPVVATRAPADAAPAAAALSVTLFSGLDTLGVLMIWPLQGGGGARDDDAAPRDWRWTPDDKRQVARAARSLALALSMDTDRASARRADERFRVAMADGLHQVRRTGGRGAGDDPGARRGGRAGRVASSNTD